MKKICFTACAAALVAAAVGAAEKPWFVVNEDNDHYFLLSSNLMNRAALERAAVTGDFRLPESLLPRFVENYRAWERGWIVWNKYPVGFRTDRGLFDTIGDREGTELALSREGARPMVNATMWAEATAIAALAHRVGETNLMATFL